MRLFFKVLGIAVVLALLFVATFELWGAEFETWFSREACARWFEQIRPVAWLAGMGLLVADLVLPVPATGVMAALGATYGLWLGALVGATGSALAGLAGYGLARLAGRRAVRWIANEPELRRFQAFFDRWGGAAIIISRILPILPEVIAVLAGLSRMRFARFLTALLLGTVPTAVLFAYLGSGAVKEPSYGVLLAVLIPLVLWPGFLYWIRRTERRAVPDHPAKGAD
jgi:uncharacterized membrane protein YdjX (TVP38/TMEM64 family)